MKSCLLSTGLLSTKNPSHKDIVKEKFLKKKRNRKYVSRTTINNDSYLAEISVQCQYTINERFQKKLSSLSNCLCNQTRSLIMGFGNTPLRKHQAWLS